MSSIETESVQLKRESTCERASDLTESYVFLLISVLHGFAMPCLPTLPPVSFV